MVINFCIDNKLTKILGVDHHVCELQLCMQDFSTEVRQHAGALRKLMGYFQATAAQVIPSCW